jgi:hypothetical protein
VFLLFSAETRYFCSSKIRHIICTGGGFLYFATTKTRRMRFLMITFLTIAVYACKAQTMGIVLDIETREPVANVQIYTNTNKIFTSDFKGRYAITSPYSSVTLSHSGYVKRTLDREEMKDTIFILPKSVSLNEVVVIGTAPKISITISKAVAEAAALGAASAPQGIGFDFFKMFKHHVSDKDRKKRHDAIAHY